MKTNEIIRTNRITDIQKEKGTNTYVLDGLSKPMGTRASSVSSFSSSVGILVSCCVLTASIKMPLEPDAVDTEPVPCDNNDLLPVVAAAPEEGVGPERWDTEAIFTPCDTKLDDKFNEDALLWTLLVFSVAWWVSKMGYTCRENVSRLPPPMWLWGVVGVCVGWKKLPVLR